MSELGASLTEVIVRLGRIRHTRKLSYVIAG